MSRKNNLLNQKITALYCRISLDDGSQNESMSISNQKLLLKDSCMVWLPANSRDTINCTFFFLFRFCAG